MAQPNQNNGMPVIIRVGNSTLSFITPNANGTTVFHPYPVKSNMSISANLRTAFREEPYLTGNGSKAVLIVASPCLLIPSDEFSEDFDKDAAYSDAITGHKGEVKMAKEIAELNVHAIFPVNNDLMTVVGDHFSTVEVQNVMTNMWQHLYRTHFKSGSLRRLFVYFHDKHVDICSFEQHRIRFANVFDATHTHDALYYIMYIWKQLGMNQNEDELYIAGDSPNNEWLLNKLRTYVKNIETINSEATEKLMPYDLTICE